MCTYSESTKSGESLFRDVLRCKGRADQTRSALTVLQRYRFLFNLPHTIEKSITNVSEALSETGHPRMGVCSACIYMYMYIHMCTLYLCIQCIYILNVKVIR